MLGLLAGTEIRYQGLITSHKAFSHQAFPGQRGPRLMVRGGLYHTFICSFNVRPSWVLPFHQNYDTCYARKHKHTHKIMVILVFKKGWES